MTTSEAAQHLSCTRQTINGYIIKGELPGYRIGGRNLRVKISDLEAMIQKGKETATSNN